MNYVLEIEGLTAEIAGKRVLREVSLKLKLGEVVALVGGNGGGKSSLASVLMGDARYQVSGVKSASLAQRDLLAMPVDERAREGLIVAWQNPVAIPGVSVLALARAAYEASGKKIEKLVAFKQKVEVLAQEVGLKNDNVERAVNDGFSGGEKKRLEMLQLLLLRPKVAVLDEIDSGLDRAGRELVVKIVNQLKAEGTAFVVITHYEEMISALGASQVLEMKDGQLQPRLS